MQRTLVCLVALGALFASPAVRADREAVAPEETQAQPPGPPPSQLPPEPKLINPPPPLAQPIEPSQAQVQPVQPPVYATAPAQPAPAGQWIYTQQYGWIWSPYDQAYTQVYDNAALAYEYVYYPTYGWRWVVAPWVLGFGVAPHWGVYGPGRFAWYAHPWFRVGTAHLRPTWGRGFAPRATFRAAPVGHPGGHGRR